MRLNNYCNSYIYRIIVLGIFSFIVYVPVYGLEIQLIGSYEETIATKKIGLRFMLEPHEEGVYKEGLRFSVDAPHIELKRWATVQAPVSRYIPLLKRYKRLFADSFTLEIDFDFYNYNKKDLIAQYFEDTGVYIAGMVLGKNGKNYPFNKMLIVQQKHRPPPLDEHNRYAMEAFFEQQYTFSGAPMKVLQTPEQKAFIASHDTKMHSVEREVVIVEQITLLWGRLLCGLKNILHSWLFGILYWAILGGFLIGLIRRWIFKKPWWVKRYTWGREFLYCCWMIWSCTTFFLLWWRYEHYGVMYGAAGCCLVWGSYYLMTASDTFWGRIKWLIGFTLGMATPPLLIKAFLRGNSFFFLTFFK